MAVVPVFVEYVVLTSMGVPDPAIGHSAWFRTVFIECDASDMTVVACDFDARPIPHAYPIPTNTSDTREGLLWPTCLHAGRWSATWLAPALTEGPIRLRGYVYADLGPKATSIEGVVRRMFRVVAQPPTQGSYFELTKSRYLIETDRVWWPQPGDVTPVSVDLAVLLILDVA